MMAYHLRYRLSIFEDRRAKCGSAEPFQFLKFGGCLKSFAESAAANVQSPIRIVQIVICNNYSPRLPCHLLCKYGNSLMILIRRIVGGIRR